MATNNTGRELGWNDEVANESQGFTLLEEGDYRFRMTALERSRHTGSKKLPPCNKAICTLEILDEQDRVLTEIRHNLYLHSSVEGILASFFLATGAKKRGEPLNIAKGFSDSVGRVGMCRIYVDEWTGDDGKARKSNKIRYFIAPDKAAETKQPANQPDPPAAPAGTQAAFAGWGKPAATNYTAR